MAVLASNRKGGTGSLILKALESEATRRGYAGLVLHAQVHAKAFYEKHGYQGLGPIFDEAGMPHLEMRKALKAV